MSGRRGFLQTLAGGALGLALTGTGQADAAAKPIRGVFPIGQTPVTPSDPMIHVSSINLNCELKTKTIEEAYTIKSNLLANDGAWLQCFGDFKKPMGPNSRYVVTNSYSLGV